MKIDPISFKALVKDGKTLLAEWQTKRIHEFLQKMEGMYVRINFSASTKFRSLNQNAYYHAEYVRRCASYTGYTTEEMHEILKWEFLPHRFIMNKRTGEMLEVAKSTTDLSASEFTEFLDRIAAYYGAEHAITFQSPQEWYDTEPYSSVS